MVSIGNGEQMATSYKPSIKKFNAEGFPPVNRSLGLHRRRQKGRLGWLFSVNPLPLQFGRTNVQLFIWRHSKRFSSWSMLDEPHIHTENYLQADVTVLARSREEALALLRKNGAWNIDELLRIEPEVIELDEPRIVVSHVDFQ